MSDSGMTAIEEVSGFINWAKDLHRKILALQEEVDSFLDEMSASEVIGPEGEFTDGEKIAFYSKTGFLKDLTDDIAILADVLCARAATEEEGETLYEYIELLQEGLYLDHETLYNRYVWGDSENGGVEMVYHAEDKKWKLYKWTGRSTYHPEERRWEFRTHLEFEEEYTEDEVREALADYEHIWGLPAYVGDKVE